MLSTFGFRIIFPQTLWKMITQLCIPHILTRLRLLIFFKKKNHIWWLITQSFPLWRTMLRPRFEFPYHFLSIFLNTHTYQQGTVEIDIRKTVSDFYIDLHLFLPVESAKNEKRFSSQIYIGKIWLLLSIRKFSEHPAHCIK